MADDWFSGGKKSWYSNGSSSSGLSSRRKRDATARKKLLEEDDNNRKKEQQAAAAKKKQQDDNSFGLDDAINEVGKFASGANDIFLKKPVEEAIGFGNSVFDWLVPGSTTDETKKKTSDMSKKVFGEDSDQGRSQISLGRNDDNSRMLGEAFGTAEKFATDVGTALLPGAAAEKFIGATRGAQALEKGGRLSKTALESGKSVAGGLVSSGVGMALHPYQTLEDFKSGQGQKDLATNIATDAVLGATGSALSSIFRGGKKLRDVNKSAERLSANDEAYLKENDLTPDVAVDPARQQVHEENAAAVAQAEEALNKINEAKTASPYHRAVDKLDAQKKRALEQSQQPSNGPHTIRSFGRDIEMTPENGYTAHQTPDGGVVYSKTATTGSNTKGDRSARNSFYSASGDKITQEQFNAYRNGIMPTSQGGGRSAADIESEYQVKRAELDRKFPEDAVMKPELDAQEQQAVQARMEAEANLNKAVQEDQALAASTPVEADPEKLKQHQADLEAQKQQIVAEATDRASYPARSADEANAKIEDITDPDLNPKNVDADGKPTPEAAKKIQAAQVERAEATVSNPSGKDELFNPTEGQTAPNATYGRIMGDDKVPAATKKAITNLSHEVHSDKILTKNSKQLVNNDIDTAVELFNSEDLLSHNPDSQIFLGNELVDAFNAADRPDLAGQVYDKMLSTSTTAGRGLRAAGKISKVSPQGIVHYAQKIADKKGKELAPETVKGLQDAAKVVAKMPDGEAKEAAIRQLLEKAEDRGVWDKMKNIGEGILSLPRTLMTSGDLSFGLRQGAILGARYPKIWAKAQGMSARMAVDEKYFKEVMQHIEDSTDKNGEALLPIYKKMGLAIEGVFGRSEETFGNTSIAESKLAKKLVVGHIVAGSDRAFSGAATVMRADVAKKIINDYGGVAEVSKWNSKALKDLGRVIDTATGRGRGATKDGWFEKAAPTLGQTLFSARLWKSRLDTLNPVYYARLSPPARKVALQSAASFASIATAVLAAAAASGAEVETDPRSSDFGKIKVGDTRYDILGGLQQNIVLATRELTGQTKSSTTGEITNLGETAFGPDRLSILGDFVQNKESPVFSTASTLLKGTDRMGNIVNPWNEIAQLFIPLGIQDATSAASANNGDIIKGAAQSIPSFFGVGANTYGPNQDTTSINISDKAKVDAAPAGQEDQYNAFYGAAKNVTGHAKASKQVTELFQQGEPEKARRKANEFNDKVDEIMAGFYAQYPDMDQDLREELNKNMYITLTKRSEAQRASRK